MSRIRYTHAKEDAEAKLSALAADPPSADKQPWELYISPGLMIASPRASYRQAFQAGGATARRSPRSDRWHIFYGVG